MLLVGQAGSGKDTIAELIGWHKMAFANPLKQAIRLCQTESPDSALMYLARHNNVEDFDILHNRNIKDTLLDINQNILDGKQRLHLQSLGQVVRRECKDFWAEALKYHRDVYKKNHNNTEEYIITDCRFKNEFDILSDEFSVFIECNLKTRIQRLSDRDGHVDLERLEDISEIELLDLKDKCNYVVRTDDVIFSDMIHVADEIMETYNNWWWNKKGAVK